MGGRQRILLGMVIAIAALAAIASCDGLFSAEIIQEEVVEETETVEVAGVSVYPKSLSLEITESMNELEVNIVPENASNRLVRWESSDETVAAVDAAGIITALFPGKVTITAITDDGEYTDAIEVHVDVTGPAGGYVFYRDEDNEHDWTYLEAAPSGWYDDGDDPASVWSNVEDVRVGTSDEVGSGQSNTEAIINQSGHTGSAAQAAAELEHEHGGVIYDDWYLPSIDELNLMVFNLARNDIGGFSASHRYWSSSENATHDDNAIARSITTTNFRMHKGGSHRVRPIRAF